MNELFDLLQELHHTDACLVRVESTQGSVPREAGAWMAVFAQRVLGSIGGGHLEWQALQVARELLTTPSGLPERSVPLLHQYALGPQLGQCCGGQVQLRFQRIGALDAAWLAQTLEEKREPVAIFGAGHVGQALVRALEPLPFRVQWVDSREEAFSAYSLSRLALSHEVCHPVADAVAHLESGSHVRIMSFSHAEDFDVVRACLQRQQQYGDLGSIGVIGSRTKWARFRSRLQARGFSPKAIDQVQCPVGLPGIHDKSPAVIAASVAAQLLIAREVAKPCPSAATNPRGEHATKRG